MNAFPQLHAVINQSINQSTNKVALCQAMLSKINIYTIFSLTCICNINLLLVYKVFHLVLAFVSNMDLAKDVKPLMRERRKVAEIWL